MLSCIRDKGLHSWNHWNIILVPKIREPLLVSRLLMPGEVIKRVEIAPNQWRIWYYLLIFMFDIKDSGTCLKFMFRNWKSVASNCERSAWGSIMKFQADLWTEKQRRSILVWQIRRRKAKYTCFEKSQRRRAKYTCFETSSVKINSSPEALMAVRMPIRSEFSCWNLNAFEGSA